MFLFGTEAARAPRTAARATFRNPICPGADPWVTRHGGFYYWCVSEADRGVAVRRSTSLTARGEKTVVWRAPERGPHSAEVWAPELHRLDGRWYIYVAASDGRNAHHRMIVLESAADDPLGPFAFKAELYTGDDFATKRDSRWAIDGTILEHEGRRFLLWSGWADHRDEQWLYIAPLANPWTLASARVRLCGNADHVWERVAESRHERGLNEGPQVLQRNGRVFVVYSCSGSWERSYKLGLLELASGGDPLDPAAWRKLERPVLSPTPRSFGVGHCSFTQSSDGTEDWIVFHAKTAPTHGWDRVIHAQRFGWDAAGRPEFGPVVDAGVPLVRPSGEGPAARAATWRASRVAVEQWRIIDTAGEASGERIAAG